MGRVLLAWEVGADYGHVMRLAALARELAQRGHVPVLALKDLMHVETVLGDTAFTVLQAPVWQAQVSGLPQPLSFAETLLRSGFLHPNALAGLCRGWRALVAATAPDLMLFDFAPTALLATRGLALRRMLIGESFASPPRSQPMPVYRWWLPDPAGRVADAERHALAGANAVLARLGQPPLACLADLLQADDEALLAFAEFDQYPNRGPARYDGVLANLDTGEPPAWPAEGRQRVFAYLKPRSRDFDPVLGALRTLDVSVVLHAPGMSVQQQRTHLAPNIRFHAQPLRMADVRRDCDLGICHAGASTTQTLVSGGKPVLLLPQHLEQVMTARRVSQLGAGLVVDPDKPAPDFKRLLKRLLDEPAFAATAQTLATKYAGDDPGALLARIADRCEALMAQAPGPA